MKAERRHDLKTNTLARRLETLPNAGKLYGTRILVGAILVVLVFLLVRFRMNTAAERDKQAADSLATARLQIDQLAHYQPTPFSLDDSSAMAQQRQYAADEARRTIQQVLDDAGAKQTQLRAEALVARGDLYWTLAHLNDLPGATTQPSLQVQPPASEALKQSEDAYNDVLQQYPDERLSDVSARFGLAAIAQEHQDWQGARQQLQAIIDDKNNAEAFRQQAEDELNQLASAEKPVYVGSAEEMAPATLPSATTHPAAAIPPIPMPTTMPLTTQP